MLRLRLSGLGASGVPSPASPGCWAGVPHALVGADWPAAMSSRTILPHFGQTVFFQSSALLSGDSPFSPGSKIPAYLKTGCCIYYDRCQNPDSGQFYMGKRVLLHHSHGCSRKQSCWRLLIFQNGGVVIDFLERFYKASQFDHIHIIEDYHDGSEV